MSLSHIEHEASSTPSVARRNAREGKALDNSKVHDAHRGHDSVQLSSDGDYNGNASADQLRAFSQSFAGKGNFSVGGSNQQSNHQAAAIQAYYRNSFPR